MREATSETYGPRVYFSNILLSDLLFATFVLRSIIPKNPKIPCCTFCLFVLLCVLARSICENYHYLIYLITVESVTTSLSRRVASIYCLCAGAVYVGA